MRALPPTPSLIKATSNETIPDHGASAVQLRSGGASPITVGQTPGSHHSPCAATLGAAALWPGTRL